MRSQKQLRAIFAKIRDMYGTSKGLEKGTFKARKGLTQRKVVKSLHTQGISKPAVTYKRIRGGFAVSFHKSNWAKYAAARKAREAGQ